VKIGRQVRMLCPWARHLTGFLLLLSGWTGSNRWQLDWKTEKVPSLSPGRGALTNKVRVPKTEKPVLQKSRFFFEHVSFIKGLFATPAVLKQGFNRIILENTNIFRGRRKIDVAELLLSTGTNLVKMRDKNGQVSRSL